MERTNVAHSMGLWATMTSPQWRQRPCAWGGGGGMDWRGLVAAGGGGVKRAGCWRLGMEKPPVVLGGF